MQDLSNSYMCEHVSDSKLFLNLIKWLAHYRSRQWMVSQLSCCSYAAQLVFTADMLATGLTPPLSCGRRLTALQGNRYDGKLRKNWKHSLETKETSGLKSSFEVGSLHWTVTLSFCSFLYNGVYLDGLGFLFVIS